MVVQWVNLLVCVSAIPVPNQLPVIQLKKAAEDGLRVLASATLVGDLGLQLGPILVASVIWKMNQQKNADPSLLSLCLNVILCLSNTFRSILRLLLIFFLAMSTPFLSFCSCEMLLQTHLCPLSTLDFHCSLYFRYWNYINTKDSCTVQIKSSCVSWQMFRFFALKFLILSTQTCQEQIYIQDLLSIISNMNVNNSYCQDIEVNDK